MTTSQINVCALMTRFLHDQFAKDYLEELLSLFGEVKAPRRVSGEMREIDVWFAPRTHPPANLNPLGLLGRLAQTPALFEPFRNAATATEIRNCMLKLFLLQGECLREAKRQKKRLPEAQLPKLWILSPTASATILNSFRAKIEASWGEGIHFFGPGYRTALVAIHQLPQTPDTLWIRLLGRGRVQDRALDELAKLPSGHPLRSNTLRFLTNLQADLQAKKRLNTEEQNLMMKLSPLYVQWEKEAIQKGEKRGEERGEERGEKRGEKRGVQKERRAMIESMLEVKFGEIDFALTGLIEPLSRLSAKEATQAIWRSSREELLSRFNATQESDNDEDIDEDEDSNPETCHLSPKTSPQPEP